MPSNETRILRLHDVLLRVGASRSSVYVWMNSGFFPKAIKISDRSVGWIEAEIENWIQKRIQAAR